MEDEADGGKLGTAELDELEAKALAALVRQGREGNATAATSCLTAVERLRKTRLAELHRERMAGLAGEALCRYLGELGQTRDEVDGRLGRRMSKAEAEAWRLGEEDRLLEVRAVEIGRMRRGDGDVPKWATRAVTGAK
jgi:hypothetical protein